VRLGSYSHGCARDVRGRSAGTQSSQTPSLIEAAIERDPSNPKLHVVLGLAYLDKNNFPHARMLSSVP
jgi:hypothetical protein